jgi:hypothetical protein
MIPSLCVVVIAGEGGGFGTEGGGFGTGKSLGCFFLQTAGLSKVVVLGFEVKLSMVD